MKTTLILLITMIVLCLLLSACAPGSTEFKPKPAGFWWGLWHGAIAPVSIIWHFFNHKVHMYETNNSGIWYDIGFFLAIASCFGGASRGGCRRKCK